MAILVSCPSACGDSLDEWTLLSTNGFSEVARGPNRFVAVLSGTLLHSSNAIDWIRADVGDSRSLNGVAYGQGRFVAVGSLLVPPYSTGVILTSPDGISWAQSALVSNVLSKVAFLNRQFLAVGLSGRMVNSTNGTDWQSVETGTSSPLRGLSYGNGLYVAIGDEIITTSTNGLNWSRSPGLLSPVSITFGQGQFVTLYPRGDALYVSTNARSWDRVVLATSGPSISGATLGNVVFAHGSFLGLGSVTGASGQSEGLLLTSADGTNWTYRSTVKTAYWREAFWGDDTLFLVGDGVAQSQPTSGPKRPPTILANPQSRVALSRQEVSLAMTGASWPPLAFQWFKQGQAMEGMTNPSLSVVAALTNAGDFHVVAGNALGSVTSSLATLTVVEPVIRSTPMPATVGGELSLQVATSGNSPLGYRWRKDSQPIPNAMTSTLTISPVQLSDGASYDVVVTNNAGAVTTKPLITTVEPQLNHPLYHWTVRRTPIPPSFPFSFSLTGVAFGNETFVAVGSISGSDFGTAYTSRDGKSWNPAASPGGPVGRFFNLYGVDFGNGVFVAVGWSSSIYSSTNGGNWTSRRTGAFGTFYNRVVFRDGEFWVGNSTGETLRSADGINWQSWPSWPGFSGLPVSESGLLATVSESPRGVLVAANGAPWALAFPSNFRLSDLAFGRGTLVAVGEGEIILQSDPLAQIEWDSSPTRILAIRGLVGRTYAIDQRDSLAPSSSWTRMTTVVLSNNPSLLPLGSGFQGSRRFYRAALLP